MHKISYKPSKRILSRKSPFDAGKFKCELSSFDIAEDAPDPVNDNSKRLRGAHSRAETVEKHTAAHLFETRCIGGRARGDGGGEREADELKFIADGRAAIFSLTSWAASSASLSLSLALRPPTGSSFDSARSANK